MASIATISIKPHSLKERWPGMTIECCRCEYFDTHRCVRHAPTADDTTLPVWPGVADTDWCGEFVPTPEAHQVWVDSIYHHNKPDAGLNE